MRVGTSSRRNSKNSRVSASRRPASEFGPSDETADRLLDRIDFDFSSLRPGSGNRMTIILRAKELDDWATDYLAGYPDAVVLHLV